MQAFSLVRVVSFLFGEVVDLGHRYGQTAFASAEGGPRCPLVVNDTAFMVASCQDKGNYGEL
jgi:hypothetical protein